MKLMRPRLVRVSSRDREPTRTVSRLTERSSGPGCSPRGEARDAGQVASAALIPIIVGLVAVAIMLVIGLGDGTRSRTQSRTAADAAALAAASAWRDDLQWRFEGIRRSPDVDTLRALLSIDPFHIARPEAENEARGFARANDADLVAFSARLVGNGVEFSVDVRSSEPAEDTGVRTTGRAVARVELTRGMCLRSGRLGIRVDGNCVVNVPRPTATTTSTSTTTTTSAPTTTETTPPLVERLAPFRAEIRLVQ